MKTNFTALGVGLLFALGLGISGMTSPERVFGFLDVFGKWDPSLLFVMLGAISVHFVASRLILKRKTPLFSTRWYLPTKTEVTRPLVLGSFLFGVGWALAGSCPGPALVSLAGLETRPLLFFVSLIAGMFAFRLLDQRLNIKR